MKIKYASKINSFIDSCEKNEYDYSLTKLAEATPYARCFAVFLLHLIKSPRLSSDCEEFSQRIHSDFLKFKSEAGFEIQSKPYRQLLAFSLSALALLPGSPTHLLHEHVIEQIQFCNSSSLIRLGCLAGQPGSGNQAMFMAIFLLHARDQLGMNTQPIIEDWVSLHLSSMNKFGFWGPANWMTHLQFQNGYHQHEILDYLGVENPRQKVTINAISYLADKRAQFAPYPGGGGCYDYDALFMLTPNGKVTDDHVRSLIKRLRDSLILKQNTDGGFCESRFVRPRSVSQILEFSEHVISSKLNFGVFYERLRQAITLQRPKHNLIHTHWSVYSRRWAESDLWDTWFRMLTLARIDVALNPQNFCCWGFINYPGIGYHPLFKES